MGAGILRSSIPSYPLALGVHSLGGITWLKQKYHPLNRIEVKGKGAGFKSWSQAGSHDFTILPRWSLEMAPLLHIELYRQRNWLTFFMHTYEAYNGYNKVTQTLALLYPFFTQRSWNHTTVHCIYVWVSIILPLSNEYLVCCLFVFCKVNRIFSYLLGNLCAYHRWQLVTFALIT